MSERSGSEKLIRALDHRIESAEQRIEGISDMLKGDSRWRNKGVLDQLAVLKAEQEVAKELLVSLRREKEREINMQERQSKVLLTGAIASTTIVIATVGILILILVLTLSSQTA